MFISDRGNLYLPDCQKSFDEHVSGVDMWMTFHDDDHRFGMAGQVQRAWRWALDARADYVLHVEEDFRFTQRVDLEAMAFVLREQTHLAQLVLKRQPWSPEEQAAGGQIETNPDAYEQCHDLMYDWVEHDTLFSLNPCLIPRKVLELGWPAGPLGVGNEAGFTEKCRAAGLRFAYWGHRNDPPRCIHVGHHRSQGWRL